MPTWAIYGNAQRFGGGPPSVSAVYTGPGDIVSGATNFWGLRAYSLASIGANAVRLRESGGNTEQDFATIAGGGLNLSAISAFKGANNLFVVKVYDQISTFDVVQATAGNQPQFILSGLGSLPVVRFVGATPLSLASAGSISSMAQPYTISYVAKRTSGSAFSTVAAIGNQTLVGFDAANNAGMYAGSTVDASAADNVFHAIQGVFNGASSDLNVDGSTNTVSPSTFSASGVVTYGTDPFADTFTGDSMEFGLWGAVFTGTQSSNMSANQHAYYGF